MVTIEIAIHEFLRDLSVGQSVQTVGTYDQGLRRFKEFLESIHVFPTHAARDLSVDAALECAKWLKEEHTIAKATLRTYLSSISRFYAYLLREKIVDISASDIERMRDAFHQYRKGGSRPLPKLPTEDAVQALLTAAHEVTPEPKNIRRELARLRNIALIEALRSSGMRVGELVKLKRDDLDYPQHSARVTGKGTKQRIVFFDDAAWDAIQAYLNERKDGVRGRALYQLPLFARHDRRVSKKVLPMTTHGARHIFNQLAQVAHIQIGMTPHSFRHAFATKILDATGDLAMVQDMLGHSSPTTTRVYAKVSPKRMHDAHRAIFKYTGEDKNG